MCFKSDRDNESRLVVCHKGNNLYEEDNIKFLGVILDSHLKWTVQNEKIHHKMVSSAGLLYKLRNKIPIHHKKKLYFGLVHSNLSYCPGIWAGNSNSNKIKIQQNKILRCVLNLPSRSSVVDLYCDSKILPLEAIRRYQILSTVFKIIKNIGHITITSIRRGQHNHDTRRRNDLRLDMLGTRLANQRISWQAAQLYNSLTDDIRTRIILLNFNEN